MLDRIRNHERLQTALGMVIGVVFGFLLQRGGVTDHDVILGQLLLVDFTVVKIMLSAIVTGMIGVYALRAIGWARLHPKSGSLGSSAVGGLIFGVGFALLGYCPGTIFGAVGAGALDALVGGLGGTLLGAWLFGVLYPRLERSILRRGDWGDVTLPELLRVNPWAVVAPVAAALTALLVWIEVAGL